MFQWKNAALAAAALLCLAGCDTPIQTVAGNYSDAPGSIGLILSDQRPPDEGKHEMMSMMPGSCGTGVVRLQDEVTKPSRVAILRQDLETALGAKMANKAIVLSRLQGRATPKRITESSGFSNGGMRSKLQQHGRIRYFSGAPAIAHEIFIIDYALNDGLTLISCARYFPRDKLCPFFVGIGDMVANVAPKGVVVFGAYYWEDKQFSH